MSEAQTSAPPSEQPNSMDRVSALAYEVALHTLSAHHLMGATPTFLALVSAQMTYQCLDAIAHANKAQAREIIDNLAQGLVQMMEKLEGDDDGKKKQ